MKLAEDAPTLFADDFNLARQRFLASDLSGMLPDEIGVDLFCGGGGATQGVEDAGFIIHECVNHSASAIETHSRNHQWTNHRQGDVWSNSPLMVAAGRAVGLLWASPDCRHFSRARGAAPVSRRVRDLAWVVIKWAKMALTKTPQCAPRVIFVENVPEFLDWGPTREKKDKHGKVMKDGKGRVLMEPVPEKKGQTFKRWKRSLEKCGYVVEWRILDAADFGAASRRKRLYVQARRDGAPICWPEATHGPRETERQNGESANGRRRAGTRRRPGSTGRQPGRNVQSHVPAADVIEWADLGRSIFGRKNPLADNTLKRIAEGIRRYILNDTEPFVLRVTQTGEGGGWHVSPVSDPFRTQTTRQDLAVCTPLIAQNYGGMVGFPVNEQLGTITAIDHHSLVAPVLATTGYGEREGQRPRCQSVAELLGTCVNGVKQGLVSPVLMSAGGPECAAAPVTNPMATVLPRDRLAMVSPVIMHNTTHHTGGPVTGTLPTVTTGGQSGIVSPVLVGAGGAGYAGKPVRVDRPLNTVIAEDHRALVAPVMAYMNHGEKQSGAVNEPLRTVVAGGGHAALVAALMVKFYGSGGQWGRVDEPVGTVTTRDRHGLVCVVIAGVEFVIVDILFRMLKPPELAAAMGFPPGYLWPKSQREATKLIGNAVSPKQAKALVQAAFPRGRISRRAVG